MACTGLIFAKISDNKCQLVQYHFPFRCPCQNENDDVPAGPSTGKGLFDHYNQVSDLGKSPPSCSALIFSLVSDFSTRDTAVLTARRNHLLSLLLSVKLMTASSTRFCTPPSLHRGGFLGNIRDRLSDIWKVQGLNTSNSCFSIHFQMSNTLENSSQWMAYLDTQQQRGKKKIE